VGLDPDVGLDPAGQVFHGRWLAVHEMNAPR
jgi:hypothetical protein